MAVRYCQYCCIEVLSTSDNKRPHAVSTVYTMHEFLSSYYTAFVIVHWVFVQLDFESATWWFQLLYCSVYFDLEVIYQTFAIVLEKSNQASRFATI